MPPSKLLVVSAHSGEPTGLMGTQVTCDIPAVHGQSTCDAIRRWLRYLCLSRALEEHTPVHASQQMNRHHQRLSNEGRFEEANAPRLVE